MSLQARAQAAGAARGWTERLGRSPLAHAPLELMRVRGLHAASDSHEAWNHNDVFRGARDAVRQAGALIWRRETSTGAVGGSATIGDGSWRAK